MDTNSMNEKDRKAAKESFQKRTSKMNREKARGILNKEAFANGLMRKVLVLRKYAVDIADMFGMIKAYFFDGYDGISWRVVAAAAAAIAYLISPIDIIPDFIPIAGFFDDAFVIGFCVTQIRSDIERYRKWRDARNAELLTAA